MGQKAISIQMSCKKVLSLLTFALVLQSPAAHADALGLFQRLANPMIKSPSVEAPDVEDSEENEEELQEKQDDFDGRRGEIISEVASLQKRLDQLKAELAEIEEIVNKDKVSVREDRIHLNSNDIKELMTREFGLCKVEAGSEPDEYIITNSFKEKIRFLFNSKAMMAQEALSKANGRDKNQDSGLENSDLAPYAVFKPEVGPRGIVEIYQHSYKTKDSLMEARMSYQVVGDQVEFVDINFLGQRINDGLFGRSSNRPYRIICRDGFFVTE